jgi:hypothetical protein
MADVGNADRTDKQTISNSEDETQLPKDQPVWTEKTVGNEDRQADDGSEDDTQLQKDQPSFVDRTDRREKHARE